MTAGSTSFLASSQLMDCFVETSNAVLEKNNFPHPDFERRQTAMTQQADFLICPHDLCKIDPYSKRNKVEIT